MLWHDLFVSSICGLLGTDVMKRLMMYEATYIQKTFPECWHMNTKTSGSHLNVILANFRQ